MAVDQTERVLWPHFLSRLREAFSLDAMSGPEAQDMAAMQAHIIRPKTLSLSEQSRLKATVDSLPPKSVADFLLSVCIKHGVDIFFYFDQAQVIDELDQFYSNPMSPLRSDPSFICLLLGIFALGSHWTPLERPNNLSPTLQTEECDPGRVFFRQAKLLVPDIIERSCLRSIQACFLLGVCLMPLSAVKSSYIYMGLALRKALTFDLHQSSDDQMLDEREREVRHRLWWSIYSLERCTTIKLNRPRSVDAGIIKAPLPTPLPSLDRAQKFDNIQLQIAYARLITILDRATDSEAPSTEAAKPTGSANAEAKLREWKKSLPEDFDLESINPRDSRYRAVFHLYLNYYYAWIAIGKVSLITAVRTTLQHHLGQESQPLRIDGAIERLSKSCTKAARKLLQLFEDLTRIRNTARFSFTDFQGCSIATIVTLIAGIIERDSTYESRVTFGLNCLRDMAAGNLTAKVGVRFVETLQAISNEAAHKLRQSGTFSDQLEEGIESLQPSAYNDWAAWLASQHQPQTNIFDSTVEQVTASKPEITSRERSAPDADLCNLQNTDEDAGWSGLEPLSTTRLLMQQPTTVSEPLVMPENDFTSTIYRDDQSFLIGLTGLDMLDFAGYSNQLD
ncbi:uncharacterized protein NECHADRAFT_54712 [Fusarium vanettenii 77-13-4]|uniref:Xylanolytic transcriptional activator regulatory domain-containing protein n=1 Tax=Fusarium vanettenii (strain ATCC MYA-4622 / CBS 123669 / FGSC 9596 / NRRL 45880 / 77-13-4) TaxID=660122 RepID=C7ZE11_FUSV7|nr:uncharacterized protein NECHADRAFT_54712 [Fusarium vanettenii 77-13-4]EEU37938.1 hypothetical protein NECHADRAFT_54712 [Fusarium vanettenii 77-13-4]